MNKEQEQKIKFNKFILFAMNIFIMMYWKKQDWKNRVKQAYLVKYYSIYKHLKAKLKLSKNVFKNIEIGKK